MDTGDKVVRAWATVNEMLADRGITLLGEVSENQLRESALDSSTFAFKAADKCNVVFHTGSSTVKKADLFQEETPLIIAVFANKPQGTTVRALTTEASNRGVSLEFFSMRELQFNVSHHVLVPKHEVMRPEEVTQMMKTYYVKSKSQLPGILESDPMARYLGVHHGDVVRITRPSPNNGKAVFYRCCR